MNRFHYFFIVALAGFMVTIGSRVSADLPSSRPVKIGLILAKSGIAAKDNESAIKAANLAVKEINEMGGLFGRPVQVIQVDNQSTPIGSKRAAEKALEHDVTAVIGAFWSSHSLPMAGVLQRAQVPTITPTCSHPDITLTGDYIFRVCFSDTLQGQAVAHFARKDLGAGTAVVLKNINEEYSLTLSRYFEDAFTQMGGKLLASLGYKGTAIDFSECLSEVKKHQPNVVFIPGYALDSGLAVKQAVGMGIITTFLGGDGWDDASIFGYAGNALEGSYYSTHWHPEVPFPRSRHFLDIWEKDGENEMIVSGNTLTYDAFMLLADAMRRAGSDDRQKIRNAIASTNAFQGATGNITFDKNGDPLHKETVFLKIENGYVKFIKSVRP